MWTDPPYGVDYIGKTKDALTIDNDSRGELVELLARAFSAADTVLAPGAVLYVAHPAGPLSIVFGQSFLRRRWVLRQTLVWVKNAFVLGRQDYHYRHEPILYGVKPGATSGSRIGDRAHWHADDAQDSVFEIDRPSASRDHPTMKPTELIRRCLLNSTKRGQVVLDPFLGSGSTLLACEEIGRRCIGLELEPKYCDVVVRRWEEFTGRKAERSTSSASPLPTSAPASRKRAAGASSRGGSTRGV